MLIAQLMGSRRAGPGGGSAVACLPTCTRFRNRKMAGEVVGLPNVWETPLRTGNLRDPNGPQATFAAESFIDEAAAAAKADPLEFRMKMIQAGTDDDSGFRRARSLAVLKAAAEKYGWDSRPSPKPLGKGDILTGRGIAYSFRGQTDGGADRRGGSESQDRSCLGEAAGVRARLRAGGQSGNPSSHGGMRHAARPEPRAFTRRSASIPKR